MANGTDRYYKAPQSKYTSQFIPLPLEAMQGAIAKKQQGFDRQQVLNDALSDWDQKALSGRDTEYVTEKKKEIQDFIDESMGKDLGSSEYGREYVNFLRKIKKDEGLKAVGSSYATHQKFLTRRDELLKKGGHEDAPVWYKDYERKLANYTKAGGKGFEGEGLGDPGIRSGVNLRGEVEKVFDNMPKSGRDSLDQLLGSGVFYKKGWTGISGSQVDRAAMAGLRSIIDGPAGRQLDQMRKEKIMAGELDPSVGTEAFVLDWMTQTGAERIGGVSTDGRAAALNQARTEAMAAPAPERIGVTSIPGSDQPVSFTINDKMQEQEDLQQTVNTQEKFLKENRANMTPDVIAQKEAQLTEAKRHLSNAVNATQQVMGTALERRETALAQENPNDIRIQDNFVKKIRGGVDSLIDNGLLQGDEAFIRKAVGDYYRDSGGHIGAVNIAQAKHKELARSEGIPEATIKDVMIDDLISYLSEKEGIQISPEQLSGNKDAFSDIIQGYQAMEDQRNVKRALAGTEQEAIIDAETQARRKRAGIPFRIGTERERVPTSREEILTEGAEKHVSTTPGGLPRWKNITDYRESIEGQLQELGLEALSAEDYQALSTSNPVETISTASTLPKEELNDPFTGKKIQAYAAKLEQDLNNNPAMATYWHPISGEEIPLQDVRNSSQLGDGLELLLLNQKGNINDGFIATIPGKRLVPKPGFTKETAGLDPKNWTEVDSERTVNVKFNDVSNQQITQELAKDYRNISLAANSRGEYDQARIASDMANNILGQRDVTTITDTKPGMSNTLAAHDLPQYGKITWTVSRKSQGGYELEAKDPTGNVINLTGSSNPRATTNDNPQAALDFIQQQEAYWLNRLTSQ